MRSTESGCTPGSRGTIRQRFGRDLADRGGRRTADARRVNSHPADESALLHGVALALMLLDLVTLTAMLYFSGGAGNPFSFFYFVNLAVGGVMIRPKAAWSLTVTAIAGYTFLLLRLGSRRRSRHLHPQRT